MKVGTSLLGPPQVLHSAPPGGKCRARVAGKMMGLAVECHPFHGERGSSWSQAAAYQRGEGSRHRGVEFVS